MEAERNAVAIAQQLDFICRKYMFNYFNYVGKTGNGGRANDHGHVQQTIGTRFERIAWIWRRDSTCVVGEGTSSGDAQFEHRIH